MLDEVGPNPMPRAPSTNEAANPATATSSTSSIVDKVYRDYLIFVNAEFDVRDANSGNGRRHRPIARHRYARLVVENRTRAPAPPPWHRAKAKAYAPYSRFPVGAALRTDVGRRLRGCNVENAAFPQGTCAEAGAIAAMVAGGERRDRRDRHRVRRRAAGHAVWRMPPEDPRVRHAGDDHPRRRARGCDVDVHDDAAAARRRSDRRTCDELEVESMPTQVFWLPALGTWVSAP